MARLGQARQGNIMAGAAGPGTAWRGNITAGRARHGTAWRGGARQHQGRQGVARQGGARQHQGRHFTNAITQRLSMSIKDGVQEVVNEIYDEFGHVKPSALVEAARPEDSPAHGGFEWDDDLAAEQFRLQQARQWIRIVKVEVSGELERLIHVNCVNIDTSRIEEGYYKPVSVIRSSPEELTNALGQLQASLEAAREAVEELLGTTEDGRYHRVKGLIAEARAAIM